MRKSTTLLFTLIAATTAMTADDSLRLLYRQPAEHWTEALPVGNGRLGAMIFGGIESEHLQLNEATLWSGAPRDWNNPGAKEVLPQVRAALFAGDFPRATELSRKIPELQRPHLLRRRTQLRGHDFRASRAPFP